MMGKVKELCASCQHKGVCPYIQSGTRDCAHYDKGTYAAYWESVVEEMSERAKGYETD